MASSPSGSVRPGQAKTLRGFRRGCQGGLAVGMLVFEDLSVLSIMLLTPLLSGMEAFGLVAILGQDVSSCPPHNARGESCRLENLS